MNLERRIRVAELMRGILCLAGRPPTDAEREWLKKLLKLLEEFPPRRRRVKDKNPPTPARRKRSETVKGA
jgi:hypothetical protein